MMHGSLANITGWISTALIAAALAAVCLMMPTEGAAQTKEGSGGRVLRHIVMYKFKEGVTPEQVQQVIDAFAKLPKQIDTIVGFEHGQNVSKEGKSEGFTHVFVVSFRDEKGLAAYLVHPAHDEYVKVVRDKREKVVVFDYWTGEEARP